MADENTNTNDTQDQQQSSEQSGELGDAGKRAIEAERKARKEAEKALRDLQKAQSDAEMAAKPETERIKAQIDTANAERDAAYAERDQARTDLEVLKAAVKYGLSEEDVEFLTGSPEEIDAKAKKLAGRLNLNGAPRQPKPDRSQGGDRSGSQSGPEQDFANFLNQQLNRT